MQKVHTFLPGLFTAYQSEPAIAMRISDTARPEMQKVHTFLPGLFQRYLSLGLLACISPYQGTSSVNQSLSDTLC